MFTRSGGRNLFGQGKGLVGGRRVGGSGGRSPPDAGKICKIFYKHPMKNYNFSAIFQNFNEKFCDFYKSSRIFRENLLTNQNYAVVDAGENFKIFY